MWQPKIEFNVVSLHEEEKNCKNSWHRRDQNEVLGNFNRIVSIRKNEVYFMNILVPFEMCECHSYALLLLLLFKHSSASISSIVIPSFCEISTLQFKSE